MDLTFPRHVHKPGLSKIVKTAAAWEQAEAEGWSLHPIVTEPFVTADDDFVYPSGPVYGRPEGSQPKKRGRPTPEHP